jgi:hypothetical protein
MEVVVAESIFTSQVPLAGNVNDGTQYTLGTVWTPAVNGTVTHIRVYAPASAPASPFVGVLYSVTDDISGVELSRATFGALTPSAWNTVELPGGGVSVTAGQYYAATYITPDFFVLTTLFFTSSGVTNGNLTAIQSGAPFGNGRIHVGDGFPEVTSGQQACYFADVVFDVAVTGTAVTGALEAELPGLVAELDGDVSLSGVLTSTLPTLSMAASGTVSADGTLTATLPTMSAAVSGSVEADGLLSITLPTMTAAATGTVLQPVDGDLDAELPALEADLVGETVVPPVIDIFSQAFAIVTGVGMCIVDDLERTEWGVPDRVCLAVPGEIAWDECQCGQFAQTITQDVPSENFPIAATDRRTTACGPQHLAVSVTASLTRCVTGINRRDNKPPTCEELLNDARRLEDDRTAMRMGVTCCLLALRKQYLITDFTVGAAVTVGPQGGCVGVELTYQFGISNVCC